MVVFMDKPSECEGGILDFGTVDDRRDPTLLDYLALYIPIP